MFEPHPVTKAALESDEPVMRKIGVGPWEEEHPGEPRPTGMCYDEALLEEGDARNVCDIYRYWTVEAIREDLDRKGRNEFVVAVENWTHDFNIGSMVRSANAFGAQEVYIIGPHKWNRKGSLMTELYQHVYEVPTVADLVRRVKEKYPGIRIIAVDNVERSVPIETYDFPTRCLMIFGAEGPGLSQKALDMADDVIYITQVGSVRSINAGAAAAITMHSWVAQKMRERKREI